MLAGISRISGYVISFFPTAAMILHLHNHESSILEGTGHHPIAKLFAG
jgi:hypothetical protein